MKKSRKAQTGVFERGLLQPEFHPFLLPGWEMIKEMGVVSCSNVSEMNLIYWNSAQGDQAHLNTPDRTSIGRAATLREHLGLVRYKHVV